MDKNIYFAFSDYAKAFDCVDRNTLWKILKEMGIPDHLICLVHFHFSLALNGEGNGNPLQCSWASLVAQLVKNPAALQESWV